MFGIIKKMFVLLLASIGNASSYTKCVSLSDQSATFNLFLLFSS